MERGGEPRILFPRETVKICIVLITSFIIRIAHRLEMVHQRRTILGRSALASPHARGAPALVRRRVCIVMITVNVVQKEIVARIK